MTYFSQFEINPQRREAKKLLANTQALHAAVLSLFPPLQDSKRILWRLDSKHPAHTLYVVSPERPDFAAFEESLGWQSSPGQSLNYQRFLDQITSGSEWLFRLQANPTKSLFDASSNKHGNCGKVIPLVKEDQQLEWLISKAPRYGFRITETQVSEESDKAHADLRVVENREVVFSNAPPTAKEQTLNEKFS